MRTPSTQDPQQTELKQRLQQVIGEADDAQVAALATALADTGFEVVRAPEPGLMMMQVQDGFGTRFYLGEVLVTRAEVRRPSRNGYGCCMVENGEAALALACLDALDDTADAAVLDRIAPLVADLEAVVARRRERRTMLAATTRVDFRSMAEE